MSRSDATTDRLRVDILDGAFPPGARLVELQLTDRYGVGRAAIRSAIVELVGEGLVTREANRGATVRRVPLAEAVQITEARQALESLLAGHAALNATQQDRTELKRLATDMSAAVKAERYVDYSELNQVLHQQIAEIARHEIARDLVANLRNRASHHQFRLALQPGRPAESLPQHEALIAALVAGDKSGSEEAMRSHLDSVISALRHWADLGVER